MPRPGAAGRAPSGIVILMGVAGAGKTTVGRELARALGRRFYDADALHPVANVRKMARGVALTDRDRAPWLQRVHELIVELEGRREAAVIACSALKESYRRTLLAGTERTAIAYLRVAPSELERRLRERRGHFFDPELLASQLAALEEPADVLTVDGGVAVERVVAQLVTALTTPATRGRARRRNR